MSEQLKSLHNRFVEELPKIEGWCSVEKADALAAAINEIKPTICVEIGVFGGSSLIPQGLALQALGIAGVVVGIDPWETQACLEGCAERKNAEWWAQVKMENIYQSCVRNINRLSLESHVVLVRDTAENAAIRFQDASVGLLHIDGNHTEVASLRDAKLYLPKVKVGGYIFFDDIGWQEAGKDTTKAAFNYLIENGCVVVRSIDSGLILRR